eukprot:CAMPEP_0197072782 /NCGR_PEP_ID=MMETSP1384-20130603/210272_1 /TAXON_ID=29189 /ORGANISM="Ammonia sp." /LENGTH=682 /DNA_ID=CAMNT_0042511603 /DNA_START=373 /DNA_END=2421 /DNA_ORIENTATION=+
MMTAASSVNNAGTPTYTTDSIIGDYNTLMEGTPTQQLKKYLEPYSKDEIVNLLMSLATNDDHICQALLNKIKSDKKWCKLFVHGLAFSTKKETLESHYQKFGKVKEAVVLVDKKGNSKGFGFVTFENAKSALEAAKDPKKRIDNRVTHCNLAFKGNPKKFAMQSGVTPTTLSPKQRENANDRRLFVHSLAWKTNDESLAEVFREYGELQEAVVIRDKKTQKSKGYGFVTFRYSESASQALMEPNKKIDGRQTHCNYACERGNIAGLDTGTLNSPNSMSSPNAMNNASSSHLQNEASHSMTSPPHALSNNMSNLSMTSSNFPSNPPLSLNQLTNSNNLSNRLPSNTALSSSMHSSSNFGGTGIHIPSIQSMPSYQPSLNLSMSSPQRRPMNQAMITPTYAPQSSAYGANPTSNGAQPSYHGAGSQFQHTPIPHPSTLRQHDLSSPFGAATHSHPEMNLLRSLQQPTSPIPSTLPSLPMGLHSLIGRNTTPSQGGSSGFPATGPTNLVLGHSQNQTSNAHANPIVVSGIGQNMFASPMHPPATPPYTHVNAPQYNGGIPNFKPNDNAMNGGLSTIAPKKIITANTMHMNLPQLVTPTPQQQQQQQQQAAMQAQRGNANANNNNNMMLNAQPIQTQKITVNKQMKPAPLKINAVQTARHPTDEGNMSPKSQCGSDDEGEDDVRKK